MKSPFVRSPDSSRLLRVKRKQSYEYTDRGPVPVLRLWAGPWPLAPSQAHLPDHFGLITALWGAARRAALASNIRAILVERRTLAQCFRARLRSAAILLLRRTRRNGEILPITSLLIIEIGPSSVPEGVNHNIRLLQLST